jgi:hypothetical protein
MPREIPLTHGYVAIVDNEDYEWLSQWRWNAAGSPPHLYARRIDNERRTIHMHRVILDAPQGIQVDHINGNRFDNRRSNLRCATHQQNQFNRGARRNGSSQYKGVSWIAKHRRWQATIAIDSRNTNLGWFTDEVEAARAYDAAARIHHGEFAYLNFPAGPLPFPPEPIPPIVDLTNPNP